MNSHEFQPQYTKDNLIGKPLAYYLDAYAYASPQRIGSRLRIPYDWESGAFTFSFLGRTFTASFSDLRICPGEPGDDLFQRNPKARILLLRYLLYSSVFFPDGEFRSYRELPSGELYYQVFSGRCIRRLTKSYALRLDDFKRAASNLGAILRKL